MTLDYEKLRSLDPQKESRHPYIITEGRGADISSNKPDVLDSSCVTFCKENRGAVGVDLGCGLGRPSLVFAYKGAQMWAYDRNPLGDHFRKLTKGRPDLSINFVHTELASLPCSSLPPRVDFLYSQRTLHYLTFSVAKELIAKVVGKMCQGGTAFISVSGLKSELGHHYAGKKSNVENRFDYLAPDVQKKHNITEPICLYTENDLVRLMTEEGLFTKRLIFSSDFGNVKGIFDYNPG